MRTTWVAMLILIVMVSGCIGGENPSVQEAGDNITTQQADAVREEGGIEGLCDTLNECREYCQENLDTCLDRCDEDPGYEICRDFNIPIEEEETFTEEPPVEDVLNITCDDFKFTEYFADPAKIDAMSALGGLHGSGEHTVGRSYVSLKEGVGWTPIHAPTKMVLTAGSYRESRDGPEYPDYTLGFDAGCNITLTFDHVKDVVPAIKDRIPKTNESYVLDIEPHIFEAGEEFGYFHPIATLDIIVDNQSHTNQFTNQERYKDTTLLHNVCPFDLYPEDKKMEYYELLVSASEEEKDCGDVSRDVPGSISGQWFLNEDPEERPRWYINEDPNETPEEPGNYGTPVSVVYNVERVEIGNLGPDNAHYVWSVNPTYMNPEEVSEHCYQFYPDFDEPEGYAYFKLIDDTTISIYYSEDGTCPANFPDGEGIIYYK